MAFLTGKIAMFALLPGLECVLHYMTGHAKLRVLFCMFVVSEPDNTTDDRHKEEQQNNGLMVFLDKL
jgi:hypothetical protein